MILLKIDEKGIEKTRKNLLNLARDMKVRTNDTLKQVADLGWQYAQNLAPEYTGALKAALIHFKESPESWIILSGQPAGDTIPTHILFDMGTYPKPRRASSLRFMEKTAEFLRTEFSQKLNLEIRRSIERNVRK